MLNYNFYESKSKEHSNQLLVMLHGFISDASTFDKHIEHLAKHTSVLTIELPGHGADQSLDTETWDFAFIQQQLDEVLQTFRKYDITMHGYSMGGRTALYYALHGKSN